MHEAYRVTLVLGNGKSLLFDEVGEWDLKRILRWYSIPFFNPKITLNTAAGVVMLDMSYVVAIEYDNKIYRKESNESN